MCIRPFLQIQSHVDMYSYPLSKVNSKDVSAQVYNCVNQQCMSSKEPNYDKTSNYT